MKSFRTIKKNAKALSPVVASIILIAVTVAVSVVVAAWMGGMSIGLMGNAEQATITNLSYDNAAHKITATVQNTGSGTITITQVYVTGTGVTSAVLVAGNTTIPKGSTASTVGVTITGSLTSGNEYTVKFVTSKANSLSYAQTMP
jgi:archaeal type IV pilus assembly protein PilA